MTHTERESRQMTKCLLQRLAWLNRTGQTYDITNEQYSVYPRAICDTTGNPNKGTKAKWTDKLSKHWRKNQGGRGGGQLPPSSKHRGGRAPLHLAMILRTLKLDLHALYCHVHVKHPICSQNALKLTQRDMKNQNFTGGACLQIPLDHGELNPLVNHHSASCFQPPTTNHLLTPLVNGTHLTHLLSSSQSRQQHYLCCCLARRNSPYCRYPSSAHKTLLCQ